MDNKKTTKRKGDMPPESKTQMQSMSFWKQLVISIVIAVLTGVITGGTVYFQVKEGQGSQLEAERIRRLNRIVQLGVELEVQGEEMQWNYVNSEIEAILCNLDPKRNTSTWDEYSRQRDKAHFNLESLKGELRGLCITNRSFFGEKVTEASMQLANYEPFSYGKVNVEEMEAILIAMTEHTKNFNIECYELCKRYTEQFSDQKFRSLIYTLINAMVEDKGR